MLPSLSIPVHSFVDLITNSSSEIYVYADEGTVTAVKELINNLLKGVGSDKTSDDLFTVVVGVDVENPTPYKDRKPGDSWYVRVPADSEAGKAASVEQGGEYPIQTRVLVTAKEGTPEAITLAAKTLSNLTKLFSMESRYNG